MLYIITGGKNSGKTSLLERISKTSKGYGVLTKKIFIENKIVGYYLLNMNTEERSTHILEKTRFFEAYHMEDYEENQRFCFINSSYNKGIQWIKDGLKTSGSLFIDEIGELEFVKKKGFYSVIRQAIMLSKVRDVYIGIRDQNLKYIEEMKKKTDFEYKLIKPLTLTAVILASGSSQRFGHENKLLMKLGDKTMIERTLDQIVKAGFFNHIVVIYHDEEIKKVVSQYHQVEALYNEKPEKGISESIKMGVRWAQTSHSDGYMFIAADQVGITTEVLRRVAEKFFESADAIIEPVFIDESGSPLVFPNNLTRELLQLQGDVGGKSIIQKNNYNVVKVYFESKNGLYDIDTLEDYHNYLFQEYSKL